MKVCLISGEYPPMQGGVGDYTRELGRALVAQGVEVCVVTSVRAARDVAGQTTLRNQVFSPKSEEGGPFQPSSLARVLSIAEKKPGFFTTPGPLPRDDETGSVVVHPIIDRWDWRCWAPIVARVREHRADILHIQYQTAAYGMHPAINLLPLRMRWLPERPRVAVTFHDLRAPYLFPKAGPVRWWITLALARWSDVAVLTNIEDLVRLRSHPLIRSLPVDLSVIPIGSNIAPQPPTDYDRRAWRRRWGVGPEETLLSYFGFLNESKGGETLIQALAELVGRGLPVRLLMVGGQVGDSDPTNVAYLRKVQGLVNELGLGDHVLWTGFTPDQEVSANLLASDICVLPYRDGASFRRGSFMAALAHGLPTVTTQPSSHPTIEPRTHSLPHLVHGQNVYLVSPDDPTAVARAIAGLVADPALRQRLAHGAQVLAAHFTWDRIARDMVKVYEEVLRNVSSQ